MGDTVLGNLITEVTSLQLYCILLIKSKSLGLAPAQVGGVLQGQEKQEAGITRAILESA